MDRWMSGQAVQKSVTVFHLHLNKQTLGMDYVCDACEKHESICCFAGLDFRSHAISASPSWSCAQSLWDLILHCSKQHLGSHGSAPKHVPGKNGNGPDSMWNKNAATLDWEDLRAAVSKSIQNMRWEMMRNGEGRANKGRWEEGKTRPWE